MLWYIIGLLGSLAVLGYTKGGTFTEKFELKNYCSNDYKLSLENETAPFGSVAIRGSLFFECPTHFSILDIQSTTKGVLIPRMTKTQRNAISFPNQGLLIYQLDMTPTFSLVLLVYLS